MEAHRLFPPHQQFVDVHFPKLGGREMEDEPDVA